VLFEKSVAKFAPDVARPLWERWARYEYLFGDLASAHRLDARFVETFAKGMLIFPFSYSCWLSSITQLNPSLYVLSSRHCDEEPRSSPFLCRDRRNRSHRPGLRRQRHPSPSHPFLQDQPQSRLNHLFLVQPRRPKRHPPNTHLQLHCPFLSLRPIAERQTLRPVRPPSSSSLPIHPSALHRPRRAHVHARSETATNRIARPRSRGSSSASFECGESVIDVDAACEESARQWMGV
jgi:hypothetical protein